MHTAEFHLHEIARIGKSIETESRQWLPEARRRGEWGVTFSGYWVSFGVMKMFRN